SAAAGGLSPLSVPGRRHLRSMPLVVKTEPVDHVGTGFADPAQCDLAAMAPQLEPHAAARADRSATPQMGFADIARHARQRPRTVEGLDEALRRREEHLAIDVIGTLRSIGAHVRADVEEA